MPGAMFLEEIRLFYLGNALGWKRSGKAQSVFSHRNSLTGDDR